MSSVRARVVQVATNEIGKRNPSYADREFWCGRFVYWCYEQAGIVVPATFMYPGGSLTRLLPVIETPEPGDMVRYANGHAAIVAAVGNEYHVTVDGTNRRGLVQAGAAIPSKMPRTYYSIEELIRCYHMTGAPTGEVA